MRFQWLLSLGSSRPNVYEGADDEAAKKAAADAAAKKAAEDEAARKKEDENKKFTQADVDRIVQDRVKKTTDKVTSLENKLKETNLTLEQKQGIETQLEEVRNTLKTEKQLAEDKLRKEQEEATKKVKTVEGERDYWKNLYTSEHIEGKILSAAVENKAFVPAQVVSILRPDTYLTEELDANSKPTGKRVAKAKFKHVKDGKEETLDLTISEAVKRMTELPEKFGNLFQSEKTKGLGLTSVTSESGGKGPPLDDQKAYEKFRSEGGKI